MASRIDLDDTNRRRLPSSLEIWGSRSAVCNVMIACIIGLPSFQNLRSLVLISVIWLDDRSAILPFTTAPMCVNLAAGAPPPMMMSLACWLMVGSWLLGQNGSNQLLAAMTPSWSALAMVSEPRHTPMGMNDGGATPATTAMPSRMR